jgi:hypothetical protein
MYKPITAFVSNRKGDSSKVRGSLCVGSQCCYDIPGILLTFETSDSLIEIRLPKEICEEISERIYEYSKALPDESKRYELI